MPQPTLSSTNLPVDECLATAPLVSYERASPCDLLARTDVLAVIGFGSPGAHARVADGADEHDPRFLHLGMMPLADSGAPRFEVWRGSGPVSRSRSGNVRHASDGHYSFVAIELDEAEYGGLTATGESAYAQLLEFVTASTTPHVLRLWNYLDAINLGDGDEERYRQFCAGRALGAGGHFSNGYPAATAIGRRDGVRKLQVYGLTSEAPGFLVENPRQVSAWRYPRQYGPVAPVFARAMRDPSGPLLISGTAAVVGHASQHPGDIDAQLDETIRNLHTLLNTDREKSTGFGAGTLLKVYVPNPADADRIAATLRERFPELDGLLLLGGDICRHDLLVEIDGMHV